jgi:hypothetical protein
MAINGSTISGNIIAGDKGTVGGGLANYPAGSVRIYNTIVAANNDVTHSPVSTDLYGAVNSLGHNLIGNGEGGSGYAATDMVGRDPKLGPLQDNGGPTKTMALLPGSPAIGAGALTDSEWDQRGPGYPRSVNGATDIGAYEVQDSPNTARAVHPGLFAEPGSGVLGTLLRPFGVPALGDADSSTSKVAQGPAVAAANQLFSVASSEQAGWLWFRAQHVAFAELDPQMRDLLAAEVNPLDEQ